ncbi:MAG: two-component sensor histidine kinase [Burkholderiales bacterium]|jgi:two-component system OmpR family sensor kinase|nr:MAG: two-component sensor histidine kinase [Burkholderiales bacterium]
MDGFQARLRARLKHSLQFRLSFFLAVTSLFAALVAGVVSFTAALAEAHELQDSMLKQISVLAAMTPSQHAGRLNTDLSTPDADEETRVSVQWVPRTGLPARSSESTVNLNIPSSINDGLHTLSVDGEDYRVVIRSTADGSRVVVAQEAGMRNEIARGSALRTIAPMLLLAPLLVLVVATMVRKLLTPITQLSEEVNARSEQALHPVEVDNVPVELRPFLAAINGLLARVKQSMDMQRRFLADAAHELRSPLAALSLQTERLAQADMSATAKDRLITVREGIERGRHLLEQLLSLARAQADSPRNATSSVAVDLLVRKVIEDFIYQAEAKSIDLGMSNSDDAVVVADEMAILTVVKNLVDNAIRYSPQGSQIDVGVHLNAEHVNITVSDHGPGIPAPERERVFEPFYRILGTEESGSGLGLSIVKEIAARLEAEVTLTCTEPEHDRGLTVTLSLPCRRPST